ncbi:MAG TPA: M20/M25/M40 family metallo-hydrolase, partial [Promineifilum sp.]|nr:M20/M25/M40 family metallo-hydrolase [Promineifilum sp.]
MSIPLQYANDHQQAHLGELMDFLRFPSVSTLAARNSDTAATANWLAQAMTNAGLENVQVIPTKRHPLVYADWLHAGVEAPTVLIYGHYDVQPAEPLELWETPPFEPTIRDDYLYARGASDDKGQVYIHVKAVEAYLRTIGRLPVNVKFIVEGEEEIGSRNLHEFIPANRELLAADSAL